MATLTRLRIDLATGKLEKQTFATGTANEYPTINPAFTGKRHRYAYIASNPIDRESGLQQRISRIDFETAAVATHDFGPAGYVGEPLFGPTRALTQANGAEDDGVVIVMVFNSASHRTDVVGLDARDLAARPLFNARLRHHVPYPLHGTFTPKLF
jgi:all-trans-8'-apo-beta-carotenal 15,15'-oxygenase